VSLGPFVESYSEPSFFAAQVRLEHVLERIGLVLAGAEAQRPSQILPHLFVGGVRQRAQLPCVAAPGDNPRGQHGARRYAGGGRQAQGVPKLLQVHGLPRSATSRSKAVYSSHPVMSGDKNLSVSAAHLEDRTTHRPSHLTC
jgi:hypothetical protein